MRVQEPDLRAALLHGNMGIEPLNETPPDFRGLPGSDPCARCRALATGTRRQRVPRHFACASKTWSSSSSLP
jgi:hypothetical protein